MQSRKGKEVEANKSTGSRKVVPPLPLFGGEGYKKEAPSSSERILHIDVRLHGLFDEIFQLQNLG